MSSYKIQEQVANLLIQNPKSIGDVLHNEYVRILTRDIPDTNISRAVINICKNVCSGSWILYNFSKKECKTLNTLMKTVNKTTIEKRMDAYLSKLKSCSWPSQILDSEKILKFEKEFNRIKERGIVIY